MTRGQVFVLLGHNGAGGAGRSEVRVMLPHLLRRCEDRFIRLVWCGVVGWYGVGWGGEGRGMVLCGVESVDTEQVRCGL